MMAPVSAMTNLECRVSNIEYRVSSVGFRCPPVCATSQATGQESLYSLLSISAISGSLQEGVSPRYFSSFLLFFFFPVRARNQSCACQATWAISFAPAAVQLESGDCIYRSTPTTRRYTKGRTLVWPVRACDMLLNRSVAVANDFRRRQHPEALARWVGWSA